MSFSPTNPLYIESLHKILQLIDYDFMRGKSILVTGATGMIGSCLIDTLMLLNKDGVGVTVYAVGRSREKVLKRFSYCCNDSTFKFLEQDVQDPLPMDLKVDFIIPLASYTHPLAYSQFPIETIFINVNGARNALELAARCGATVIYPSSVEIYGNAYREEPFKEQDTGELYLSTARACYTESKRLCEAMCQSYISERGVDARILRFSRVFGPTMLMEDSKASSQFIKKAIAGEDIILKSEGNQFFSYTYVLDAISAILCIIGGGCCGEAYNVASKEFNVYLRSFASACAKYAGTNVVFDIPSEIERKGYSVAAYAIMDGTKLNDIGWKPLFSFKDAIRMTLSLMSQGD